MNRSEELNDTIEGLRKRRSDLLFLRSLPGWKVFSECLDQQIRARRTLVFQNRIRSLDEAFQIAGQQAECDGLVTAKGLVEALLADLEEDLGRLIEMQKEMEGTEG